MTVLGNKEIFAKNLKRYIELSGKDRRDLADTWGFKYSTVSEWLNAKKYPRIDKIQIMADYFGIAMSDLIEEKTIENSPVEMAERHVEMIMDEDLNEIFDDFKSLDAEKKKIIKDLVRNLAETKTEA